MFWIENERKEEEGAYLMWYECSDFQVILLLFGTHIPAAREWNGMEYNMFFGPKAQRWNQQGHSAPKMRKKK